MPKSLRFLRALTWILGSLTSSLIDKSSRPNNDSARLASGLHDEFANDGLLPWRTVRETFAELSHYQVEASAFPEGRLKNYRLLSEGQNWKDLPVRLQKEAMGQSWYAGGGKTGFYRRLALDRPSPTLVTAPTMPATDLCHPTELRPLSVQEYCAIQTYPADFALAGRTADKYRQLGNAVPCLFGKVVGTHLVAFDEGSLLPDSGRFRFSRYHDTDHISWSGSQPWLLQ